MNIDQFGLSRDDFATLKEYRKVYNRLYRQTDAYKQSINNYQKTEAGKEARKKAQKRWNQENRGKVNAINAKRRAAKLQRTPSWADLEAIKQFYLNCPPGKVVDHDIPLQGKNVSGLHVVENLRYLTPKENRRKSNKYEQ